MKRVHCKELGDPKGPMSDCEAVFQADNFEELVEKVTEHIHTEPLHAPEAEAMENASEEEREYWLAAARNVYDGKDDEPEQ